MYNTMTKKLLGVLVLLFVVSACGGGLEPAPNGEACEIDLDCESDLCLTVLGTRVVQDGLCTNDCDLETDEGCDADSEICLRFNQTGEDFCYPTCAVNEDCREGYACVSFLTDPRNACVPVPPSNRQDGGETFVCFDGYPGSRLP